VCGRVPRGVCESGLQPNPPRVCVCVPHHATPRHNTPQHTTQACTKAALQLPQQTCPAPPRPAPPHPTPPHPTHPHPTPTPTQARTQVAVQLPQRLLFDVAPGGALGHGGGSFRSAGSGLLAPSGGDGGDDADAFGINLDVQELNLILRL
jgi:hypothetical protein